MLKQINEPNSWPIALDEIINCIAYLSYTGLSSSTISTYISGISYVHKIRGLTDSTNSFLVTKMLEGLRRKSRRYTDLRAPVTLGLLHKLIRVLAAIECVIKRSASIFKSSKDGWELLSGACLLLEPVL
jgi:hypothetical protein